MTGPVTPNGTATYNLDDDTLRWSPAERLDANEYALAKSLGFKWWGRTEAWVAVWTPAREDHLLARVGEISHEVDPDDPQARLVRFAGHAAAAVTRSSQRVAAAMQGLPPGGEPIKIGHHSEGRHRRAIERSDQNMRAAVAEDKKAEYWRDRARGTERRARQKSDPGVVRRRIGRLQEQLRQQERTLARADLSEGSRTWAQRWHDHLTLRIAFEEARLTAYKKGDIVQHKRHGKCEVLNVGRVNLKIRELGGPTKGWQWAAPPHEVKLWTEPQPQPE